jgi:hypothetical protein
MNTHCKRIKEHQTLNFRYEINKNPKFSKWGFVNKEIAGQ